jgi:hypothetical protein
MSKSGVQVALAAKFISFQRQSFAAEEHRNSSYKLLALIGAAWRNRKMLFRSNVSHRVIWSPDPRRGFWALALLSASRGSTQRRHRVKILIVFLFFHDLVSATIFCKSLAE